MQAFTVYHYPNCSTCKKALKWLSAHDVAHTTIDIVKKPPSSSELQSISRLSNTPLRKMFNTSGASYRDGNFKEKIDKMSEKELLTALSKDGKLIKRPLVSGGSVALVGFNEETYTTELSSKRRATK